MQTAGPHLKIGFGLQIGLLGTCQKRYRDIKRTFPSADLLGNGSNRVVFNIAGNSYRMICAYVFGQAMVHCYIKWIGTHSEYTKLCEKNEQYTVSSY